MRASLLLRIIRGKAWMGSGLFIVGMLLIGCSKEAWFGKERKPVYKAEITNVDNGIIIKKLNEFKWTNVTFILNKKYYYSVPEVEEGKIEFILYFGKFKHEKTGTPYDPTTEEVFRIRIEGDEGYWY